jgi:hypothetical protein
MEDYITKRTRRIMEAEALARRFPNAVPLSERHLFVEGEFYAYKFTSKGNLKELCVDVQGLVPDGYEITFRLVHKGKNQETVQRNTLISGRNNFGSFPVGRGDEMYLSVEVELPQVWVYFIYEF